MPRLLILLALAFSLCGFTCGSEAPEDTDTRIEDTHAIDIDPDVPLPETAFELGTHPAMANRPSDWRPLPDTLTVELGGQGSWMVVLGIRTRGYFEEKVELRATISVPERQLGELWLTEQVLIPGGDGYDYFYNFFLAMDIWEFPVDGKQATLTFTAIGDGHTLEETFEFTLQGGPE